MVVRFPFQKLLHSRFAIIYVLFCSRNSTLYVLVICCGCLQIKRANNDRNFFFVLILIQMNKLHSHISRGDRVRNKVLRHFRLVSFSMSMQRANKINICDICMPLICCTLLPTYRTQTQTQSNAIDTDNFGLSRTTENQ